MHTIHQDDRGWTHIDWSLDGVTADMVDWHWSNLEKTYNLWHPIQHKDFRWLVPPTAERFLGAIHSAPQYRKDGSFKVPKLRFDDVAGLKDCCRPLIKYDHLALVSCITLGDEEVPDDGPAQSYRIHQWQCSDSGVVGMSSAISFRGEPKEEELRLGLLWADHGAAEMEYLGDFLPQLYRLWSAVKDPGISIRHNLTICPSGAGWRYLSLNGEGAR